ncbi:YDG domain-containing protein [Pseudochelatococcus sp. G4_1912]|uniref:YDG domain-containing protein n=1 Tax=Pseudochelatococcus sp. G4_1912 TaxID=3114288 RepID=UPI0039C72579
MTTSRVYDGTTAAAKLTDGVLGAGVIGGDSVTLGLTGTAYNSQDVATANTITGTYVLGGASAGNYQLASSVFSAAGNITPVTLTITASAQSKVYGNADPALSYTYSGLVSGDTASAITGSLAREGGENVGVYAINKGSLAAGSNYTISYTGTNLTITPAILTVTGGTVQTSRIYDGSTKILVTSNGTVGAGVIGADDVAVSLTAAYASANAAAGIKVNGTYSLSGASAGNYMLSDSAFSAIATITPKQLNILSPGQVVTEREYDGTVLAAKLSDGALDGVLASDFGRVVLDLTDTRYNSANVAEATTISGRYVLHGAAASNYTMSSFDFRTSGEIIKATLAVSPVAGQTRIVGQSDYEIAFTPSGWKGDDGVSLLSGGLSFEGSDAPGNRFITLGNLSAGGNYDLRLTSGGTLAIVAKAEEGGKDSENKGGTGTKESTSEKRPAEVAVATERAQRAHVQSTHNTDQVVYVWVDPSLLAPDDADNNDGGTGIVTLGKSIAYRCSSPSGGMVADKGNALYPMVSVCEVVAEGGSATSARMR